MPNVRPTAYRLANEALTIPVQIVGDLRGIHHGGED